MTRLKAALQGFEHEHARLRGAGGATSAVWRAFVASACRPVPGVDLSTQGDAVWFEATVGPPTLGGDVEAIVDLSRRFDLGSEEDRVRLSITLRYAGLPDDGAWQDQSESFQAPSPPAPQVPSTDGLRFEGFVKRVEQTTVLAKLLRQDGPPPVDVGWEIIDPLDDLV